ncbi:MAG: hypothetical protein GY729_21430 [Desulfobacteraceae bacterium]|nr:hypothetical protein [Desulfobacteraceae bacterium]
MQVEQSFHPFRVYLLIRNAMILSRSSIVVVTAAVTGILMLISLLNVYAGYSPLFHQQLYLVVLFLGGILVTTRTFRELHDPVQGLSWLMVPASIPEKALARILITTVVYIAGTMLFYLIFSMVSEGLNTMILKRHHPLFNPFDPIILKGTLAYIAVQAPFLLGAVYFRKHALSKTILTVLGLSFVLGIGICLAAWLIFGDQFTELNFKLLFDSTDSNVTWMQLSKIGQIGIHTARVIFWIVTPIICWAVCYIRLKETER